MNKNFGRNEFVLGLMLPIMMIAMILVADTLEGSKTAYVGFLASVPPLAAVFGSFRMVVIVSALSIAVAVGEASLTSQGSGYLQLRRILIIVFVSMLSMLAVRRRVKNDQRMIELVEQNVASEAAKKYSQIDYLTGHFNRFGFQESIKDGANGEAALVILDFDGFKEINDKYGHQFGDEYIKSVSSRIAGNLNNEDIFGRWGGDEFVVLLKTPKDKALEIINRVITESTSNLVSIESILIPVKFSAGIALWEKDSSFNQTFVMADKALYEAKSRGGQQAVSFDELPNHGEESPHAH